MGGRIVGAALLAAALLGGSMAETEARAETPRITVTGTGTASGAPDIASLRVGVETRAREAAVALSENNIATASVIERLREAGVAEAHIQTSGFSVRPVYAQRGEATEGFQVTNAVTARIEDLDHLGAVLDSVVASGANRVDQLSFSIADPAPLMAEARAAAVAEARAAAETIAEAAGLALGPILEIQESGGRPSPVAPGRAVAFDAASVPVAAGTLEVSASVTVVWELAAPD